MKSSAAIFLSLGKSLGCEDSDPKQVASDAYFSGTAHNEGDMVSFVSDDFVDEEVWEQSDKEAVIFAAVAEAGLLKDAGKEGRQRGMDLIADTDRCGSCHPYRKNETEFGYALI